MKEIILLILSIPCGAMCTVFTIALIKEFLWKK